MADNTYLQRYADGFLADLLAEFPAVMINGPRAVGKSRTARRYAKSIVQLDNPAEALVFRADPDAALRLFEEPILLDEWQEVPEVLGAIKRAIDQDSHPARFILTGSVQAEMNNKMWPGTGRVIRMNMHGVTEAEILGTITDRKHDFLQRLKQADPSEFGLAPNRPTLPEYVALALRGGYPDVALSSRSERFRSNWFDSYLNQLISMDPHPGPNRDVHKMRKYFEALSLNTAGTPHQSTLCDLAGISIMTAESYDARFESLYITEKIPAWHDKRLQTLLKSPKRYVVDFGLAATAAHVDQGSILKDANLLGRTIDTFAVSQLRPQIALGNHIRAYHLRQQNGRKEIDLILEVDGGKILAIEFKASSTPSLDDAKHLCWLRDTIGERFLAGAVLHTGPQPFKLGDRLLALPLSCIWE